MVDLLTHGELHAPNAPLSCQKRELEEALQLQILQKDELLTADSEDDISSDLSLPKAVALSIQLYLLLNAHLSEPVYD